MDSRSKYLELYAIKATHPHTTPLAAASHLRAVSILLSTDAQNPKLTSADRRNARALSRVYETQYDEECLWSSRLTRPSLSNSLSMTEASGGNTSIPVAESGTGANTATTLNDDQQQKKAQVRKEDSCSSIPLENSPPPGIIDHVRQRVDKALERKKARRGFESAVPLMDWKALRMDVNELLDLKCDLDMDLLPEPETIEALVERSAKLQISIQDAASKLAPVAPPTVEDPMPGSTVSAPSPMDISEDTDNFGATADDMKRNIRSKGSGSTHRNGSSASSALGIERTMVTAASANNTNRTSTKTSNTIYHDTSNNSKYGWHAEADDNWPHRPNDARPPGSSTFSNGLDGMKNKKRVRTDDGEESRHADEKPFSSFITAKERLVIEEKDGNKKKFDDYTHAGSRSSLYGNQYSTSGNGNSFNNSNANSNTFGAVSGILKPKMPGAKRGKFKPPLNRSNSGEQDVAFGKKGGATSGGSGDEIIDDRLKNIEPKMIEAIKNEIMETSSTITWDDIAGLEHAKNTIMEAVIWPMLRPQLFGGLRTPPKGLLLFGPPGTGKTMIGKCIASQSNATFFNISSSSLTSKWVGDGEKMIDSLLTQRTDGEFEASRRIKTEFLIQFDGVGTPGDKDRILCIGATNRPQELDEAARRRFVKRLYIPLPDAQGRYCMIQSLLRNQPHDLTEEQIREIQDLTEGYSGSDINGLCREAAFGPIRSIRGDILNIDVNSLRPIQFQDFKDALTQVRASVSDRDLEMYMKWEAEYGSVAKS
ncbi:hypothetical protein BGW42_002976 [Actinomortierella wolfii]|nr:hypothetical protein BGW42_002976 [Actinomortierella wolfii]